MTIEEMIVALAGGNLPDDTFLRLRSKDVNVIAAKLRAAEELAGAAQIAAERYISDTSVRIAKLDKAIKAYRAAGGGE